ncbi:response regulator [Methylobacterium ajmalii]|jgi:hypothetical protein|uniref:Response regulator n=3 Tax=Methylobacterium TaxID=407 RepID=A0A2R4WMB0_9HYPH|nr:response regulator [Methylobacterium ajmalii]AWB22635.1 response regulator [Methylobacterium currus]MBK3411252.1 response regulator [Methylobacterium ajmalii]MBK3424808.1 response regulator [Methylobacterium ajmalii]MBZ6414507.1 response regulator [Methylobacterium sp.]
MRESQFHTGGYNRAVPLVVAPDADHTKLSLVENLVRVAMHPADQFEAWKALADHGHETDGIGQGTTVRLWLPQSERRPDALLSKIGEETSLDQVGHSTGYLMNLLVDDDALVRSGTAEMLEELGHTVVEAEAGFEALEQLRAREGRVDLLITDHAVPATTPTDRLWLMLVDRDDLE